MLKELQPNRVTDAVVAKVAAARRRLGLALFADRLGSSLLVAGVIAACLVVAVKIFAHGLGITSVSPVVWIGVVGLPIVIGTLVAAVSARRKWPTQLHAASALDDVAGTHDALGSSIGISKQSGRAGFESLTIEQGQAAAEHADPHAVAKIKFSGSLLYAAGCVVLAGLLAAFSPMRTIGEIGPQPIVRVQTPEAVSDATEKLTQAKEAIETVVSAGQASAKELDAIAELEQELAEGLRDPEDAIAAAADTLQNASDEVAKHAERDRYESDALQDRLRSIESERLDKAKDLAEELAQGDFEAAAEKAERLLEQTRSDSEYAEQVADEFRELANQIERESERALTEQNQQSEPEESEDPPTQEQIREELERQGVPPEEADRLAEEQQRKQSEQQAEDESRQRGDDRADEIAQELRDAADQMDQQNQDKEEPPNTEGDSDANGQEEQQEQPSETGEDSQNQQSGEASDNSDGEGSETNSAQGNQASDEPGSQPAETEPEAGSDGQSPREGQPSEQANDEGQGESQQTQDTSDDGNGEEELPDESGGQNQIPQGQPSSEGVQGQQTGQPSDQQENGAGDQPGKSDQAQPSQTGEPGGQGAGAGEDQERGLGELLRENANQEKTAREAERAAESLQEQADQLTSPGDRLDEFAQDPPINSPWEGRTEFVDARPEDPSFSNENERTVAQWFNPGNAETGGDPVGDTNPQRAVRQAEERAQRAIERQTVPRRHADVIKRVFDRLAKQAQSAQPAPPVVQDAEDAP
jgi:hypothetical protein